MQQEQKQAREDVLGALCVMVIFFAGMVLLAVWG